MPPSQVEEAKESGEEFAEQETITDANGDEITIPKGYIITDDSATLVDDGIVISDAASNGNEWVWVPVQDPSIMYEENSAGVALSGSTGVKTTRYSASGIISGSDGTRGLPGSEDYREPDLLSDTDEDNDTTAQGAGFSSLQNMAQTMVNEYNTMIASIEKYGGFYIGRYELTANGTKPGTVLTNTDWYTLYKNSTSLAKEGSNTISRMIWGAQWDVTCLWLQENGYDINNSSTWGNYTNNSVEGAGTKQPTGFSESWKANNVYDFAGNCREWTQEASYTHDRVYRGGSYSYNGSYYPATYRSSSSPTYSSYNSHTSRPTLILMPPYQATVGEEAEEQGTINGEEGTYQNPTVPKGYYPINTDTAVWDGADGPQWNNGLVISDTASNGNEWVWVPVQDPSIMYEENSAGVALSGSTGVTTTKYSKSGIIKSRGLPGSTSYREPDIVTSSDTDSYAQQAGFSSLSNMASSMVSEYSTMIDSINKYGGFYIGRYELTANGTKPGTVLTRTNWYKLYKNCTTLAKSGSNTMSRMIWGAQWDVTCLWLEQNDYDINDSTSYGNYKGTDVYSSDRSSIIKPSGTSQKLETGITTFTRANNVYDLAGNCFEWTQEASNTSYRVGRGGGYSNNGSSNPVINHSSYDNPTSSGSGVTSRPTLILSPYDQATTEDNYIGYYADIDDNGTVDGVIYADLAHAKSGTWGDSWGGYSYSAVTSGLKEYYIKGEHTESNSFGTKPVVAPVNKDDTRADRFYVMALKDVGTTTYYWYNSAYGKLDNTVSYSTNDFGDGRENTEYVMNKWTNSLWGSQNSRDMCGAIQTEVNNGWFVASKSEWAAFGGAFSITSGNYGNYGLSSYYWSSSQNNTSGAYYAGFYDGCIDYSGVNYSTYVRLSVTF